VNIPLDSLCMIQATRPICFCKRSSVRQGCEGLEVVCDPPDLEIELQCPETEMPRRAFLMSTRVVSEIGVTTSLIITASFDQIQSEPE